VLTLFLLLSQATSKERAIRLGKTANGELLVPLRIVSNKVFAEDLFPDISAVNNAIRRSTGAAGLEGKTSMLYVKEETQDKGGYLLYFRFGRNEEARQAFSFIVRRLLDSVKGYEERDGNPYRERILELLDKHINDRNLIFDSKPYIHEKLLLNPLITTVYLRNLLEIMKRHLD